MSGPRSYIVRIYRTGARSLAGLVEDAEHGSSASFQSMEELWRLLRKPHAGRKRGSSDRKPRLPAADTDPT